MDSAAAMKQTEPTTMALLAPMEGESALNPSVIGIAEARTRFGTSVVAVERMFVPNCSAVTVTNTDQ